MAHGSKQGGDNGSLIDFIVVESESGYICYRVYILLPIMSKEVNPLEGSWNWSFVKPAVARTRLESGYIFLKID